jgi:DNA repair photolyase
MIQEICVNHAVTYEYPPDGGTIPIIDPYDGCSVGCPYCFQLEDESWNLDLKVKLNIAEVLQQELSSWSKTEPVYIGSRCDPYMGIERKYQLTRKCLMEIHKLKLKCMVTTKSSSRLIIRDLDIIQAMGDQFTLLLGLSNLNQLTKVDDMSVLGNIQTANELHRMGIQVWVFITPVLPGITDVDAMIQKLDDDIPVFLDKVRIKPGTRPALALESYIGRRYPHLVTTYHDIIYNGRDIYYESMKEKWSEHKRIRFVFE